MLERHADGPHRAGAGAGADPFPRWADEPFDPAPPDAGEAERIARALEYVAYQLHHIRVSLSELTAAAEAAPVAAGRRRPGHA